MKDIKIRAWDKKENKMYYNVGVINGTVYYEPEIENNIKNNSGAIAFKNSNDMIVMISTDIKDSNNNDIYDRDIIQYEKYIRDDSMDLNFGKKVLGEIEYLDGSFVVYEDINEPPKNLSDILKDNKSNIVVIGNSIEDSDLLLNYSSDEYKKLDTIDKAHNSKAISNNTNINNILFNLENDFENNGLPQDSYNPFFDNSYTEILDELGDMFNALLNQRRNKNV